MELSRLKNDCSKITVLLFTICFPFHCIEGRKLQTFLHFVHFPLIICQFTIKILLFIIVFLQYKRPIFAILELNSKSLTKMKFIKISKNKIVKY